MSRHFCLWLERMRPKFTIRSLGTTMKTNNASMMCCGKLTDIANHARRSYMNGTSSITVIGESISAYITDLRTIARNCAHEDMTPDEIIRDRLVLGLNDNKMRERLLRITDLSLEKAIDICKAAEETSAQLQVMHGDMKNVSVVKKRQNRNQPKRMSHVNTPKPKPPTDSDSYECKYCGRRHGKRDCPAFGQICHQCNGRNHFKSCCRSKKPTVTTRKKVHVVDEHDFVVDAVEESNSNDSWIVPLYNRLPVLHMSMFRSSSQDLVAASGQRRPAKPSGALRIMQSTTTCCTDCRHCPQAHVAYSWTPQSFNVSPTRAVPQRRRFSFTHCLRWRSAPGGSITSNS